MNRTGLIQRLTAEEFGITVEQLLSGRRARTFSYPRMVAMYITRECTRLSFPQIGERFGNRHHTSVMHAVRWAADKPEYWAYIERIMRRIEDG